MQQGPVDVVIIGGGIVGCAALYHLSRQGYRCLLLEKGPHLVSGASAGNSGFLHTGFDAQRSLNETRLMSAARPLSAFFFNSHACLPRRQVGGLMLAWSKPEMEKLHQYKTKADENGVETTLVTAEEVFKLEPNVNRSVVGGLLIPGETAIDSCLTPVYMAHLAKTIGAQILSDCHVTGGQQQADGGWILETSKGRVKGQVVLNAAGLHGDVVENIAQPSAFRIRPRKGEFMVYSKEASTLVSHMLLPVPTERGKGVLVFPSVYGNLVVGPTAVDVEEKENPQIDTVSARSLVAYAEKVVPLLAQFKPIGSYAGLRPATDCKDYHLYANTGRHWITAGGIRSTGATACLGIASHIGELIKDIISPSGPPEEPTPHPYKVNDNSSVSIGGEKYVITHPLFRFGHSKL